MPEPLTPLEQRVYHYLIDFLAEHTYQPSIREIARQFRIKSTKTVSDLLHGLTTKGYIERDQSRSRGVRIIGMAAVGATQPVPVYSRARAGNPAFAAEDRTGFITLDRRFVPSTDACCVRAADDAMRSRGVLAGDTVLVQPSAQPADGDLVAAAVGDEVVVRTLARRGAASFLTSDAAPEIALGNRSDASILGVVAGVFRPFHDQGPTTALAPDPLAPVS
jgi:repressor LexA